MYFAYMCTHVYFFGYTNNLLSIRQSCQQLQPEFIGNTEDRGSHKITPHGDIINKIHTMGNSIGKTIQFFSISCRKKLKGWIGNL